VGRRYAVLAVCVAASACSDALEQTSSAGQVIAAVNAGDHTVSFVSATDQSVRTVDLQTPARSATTADGRGSTVLVPLGTDSVAVIRNTGLCSGTCVRPVVVFPVASGGGATGVAIQDDSIAWIANPARNTVTRLNYQSGATRSVAVGVYPDAVVIARGRVFVANANLVSGAPAGASWLTSFDCCGTGPVTSDSVPLTGTRARAIVSGGDSLLYVITAGHAGTGDGKLSIVDPVLRTELAVLDGLGESPGQAAFHPSGRLLVSSLTAGILEVNTLTRALSRGPGNGVKPGGHGVSDVALDLRGHVYALDPGTCAAPGVVHVLTAPPDYAEIRPVAVGTCPTGAAVATTP
jgi:hypothetical protein